MHTRRYRAAPWLIWGLVAAFAAVDASFWFFGDVQLAARGVVQVVLGWLLTILLALVATRRIDGLATSLSETEHAHLATRNELEQLQTHNAMLDMLARSADVPVAFQALAPRIARLVPCDRVGLALLSEAGDEFHTYTARVTEEERRTRPRPEVTFRTDRTAIGAAVRSRQPLIIENTADSAADFLDVNVAHTSGFASALIVPLVSKDRAVGTLNVVSRDRGAFTQQHVAALQPVTEIFAMAYVAQQLQLSLAKHRTMESMTELTLSVSTEINSALQTIIGQCDLLERQPLDAGMQRDLATVVRQAQRISALLDKMRSASRDRLLRAAETIQGLPASHPEGRNGVNLPGEREHQRQR